MLHNTNVIISASSKWFELGMELLDEHQLSKLEAINVDYVENTRRCLAMLEYWLRTHPSATWYQLVVALRAPGIELNQVAANLKEKFTGMLVTQTYECIKNCIFVSYV